jgi:pimeloyl-ACP methyl ester carboxylesterase
VKLERQISFSIVGVLLAATLCACSGSGIEGGASTPINLSPKNYADKTQECRDFIDSLPVDYFHDFITVPENPKSPNGPQIQVFYYGKKQSGGADPILFFNDGPAVDSHNSFRLMTDRTRVVAAWADAPFIFMDQRGTGCSDPYPQGPTDDVTARLRLYGSSSIVADAEAIRHKLYADKPWKIFGPGFGAFIVHRYMTLAPKSIVKAVAHGGALLPNARLLMANQISSQNRVLTQYFSQYGDDRARLELLHQYLTPTTCFPNAQARPRRCGLAVIDYFVKRLAYTPRWPWIHDWLGAMVQDNHIVASRLNDFLEKNIFSNTVDPKYRTDWATAVINFYDRDVTEFDRPTCEQAYLDLHARGEMPETYLLHDCMVALQFSAPLVDIQNRKTRLDKLSQVYGLDHLSIGEFKKSLLANTNSKFYLYSSQLDSMMPIASFQPEVADVSAFVVFRQLWASGHDGFYSEQQVADDTLNDN